MILVFISLLSIMILIIIFIALKNDELWMGIIACVVLIALILSTVYMTMDVMNEKCKEYTRDHRVIIYNRNYKLNDQPKKFTINSDGNDNLTE